MNTAIPTKRPNPARSAAIKRGWQTRRQNQIQAYAQAHASHSVWRSASDEEDGGSQAEQSIGRQNDKMESTQAGSKSSQGWRDVWAGKRLTDPASLASRPDASTDGSGMVSIRTISDDAPDNHGMHGNSRQSEESRDQRAQSLDPLVSPRDITPEACLNVCADLVVSISSHRIATVDNISDVQLYVTVDTGEEITSNWTPEFQLCWIAHRKVMQYWSQFPGGRRAALVGIMASSARYREKILAVVGHRKDRYGPFAVKVVYQGQGLQMAWADEALIRLHGAADERTFEAYWKAAGVTEPLPRGLSDEVPEVTVIIGQVYPDWISSPFYLTFSGCD